VSYDDQPDAQRRLGNAMAVIVAAVLGAAWMAHNHTSEPVNVVLLSLPRWVVAVLVYVAGLLVGLIASVGFVDVGFDHDFFDHDFFDHDFFDDEF
jgi:ABC-type dipeptide/oligopeptide/nickel transport system permease component